MWKWTPKDETKPGPRLGRGQIRRPKWGQIRVAKSEVHIVRNHCSSCSEVESRMQHPIRVRAIMAYGERFTYRIEDAKGACFNVNEACLCSNASGHSSDPCLFCGQALT
jgi:hypothetical protein